MYRDIPERDDLTLFLLPKLHTFLAKKIEKNEKSMQEEITNLTLLISLEIAFNVFLASNQTEPT